MKRILVKLRRNRWRRFVVKHEKYALIIFFIGGFIFDTLTLERIDRIYDSTILCLHMLSLTLFLYLYNLADDGKWINTKLERFQKYFPFAIQFFFGALSSAFVVYFSRSVSLSKTMFFFVILVILFITNEFLRKRISNKYLQFSVYFFISFTFFSFMVPVFIKEMNTFIFLLSGGLSLVLTLLLIMTIYRKSPSTRAEIKLGKLLSSIFVIYVFINTFYLLKLIPPVPLALDIGIIAHKIEKSNNQYYVTYEKGHWFVLWSDHKIQHIKQPNESVYAFTSIFAPTKLKKSIAHRWTWYNPKLDDWEIVEDIKYDITGGRDKGFRGYTYKNNVWPGEWKIQVITDEELVIGVIDFEIINSPDLQPNHLVTKTY